MGTILGAYMVLSVAASAGYVAVAILRVRRAPPAGPSALLVGGVIQTRRRVRLSKDHHGMIEVVASCEAEAAEVIAANRGLESREALT